MTSAGAGSTMMPCPFCAEPVPEDSKWCKHCASVINDAPVPTSAPAGWYPLRGDKRRQRYWNGQAWTDQYHEPGPRPGAQPDHPHLPVDNRFAWGFVVVVAAVAAINWLLVDQPALALVIGLLVGLTGNAICAIEDDKRVAAAGYRNFGSAFGFFLAPIYLFFRARRVHGGWWIFAAWVVVVIVGDLR